MLPPDLDPALLERRLDAAGASLGRPLVVLERTRSTNDEARRAAAAGAAHGATFVADVQEAGRGRGGRAWQAAPGEGLLLSVLLRPRLAPADVPGLALAAGLAVCDALEAALPPGALSVKWPNDVLAAERKLAGVLAEAQVRGESIVSVVVGIGVNVHTRRFPPELAEIATSLHLLGVSALDRGEIAARLLAALGRRVAGLEAGGLETVLGDLEARDALRGRRVTIDGVHGVASGVDATGRLLVRRVDGTVVAVSAGDVRRDGWP